ncbi:MAG TPA: ATP-binding protein [Thermoanaerobaculia bacterium]|nr:ATP-binding protein [Thermoanaerobaculia bacterium]
MSVTLIATVSAVTLIAIGLFAVLAIGAQRAEMKNEALRGAALFSDTIRTSTRDQMLSGKKEDAYRVMQAISENENVEKVRIFNKEGRIMFSTASGEAGTLVDKKAESCYACHAAGQPLVKLSVPSRARVFRAADGHRVLGMVTPIYNETACSSADCHVHPAEQTVLGVVDVSISLADVDRVVEDRAVRTAWVSLVCILAIAVGLMVAVRRLVLRPVREMVKATERIGRGDLLALVPVFQPDELGRLATSFNEMADSLAKARAERLELLNGLERQVEERTEALRAAQAQLIQTEKLASLGQLSASIAHEINNPLAGILTFSKLLVRNLEEGGDPATSRDLLLKNLRLIERETDRCRGIVRNLLDFARQRPLVLADVDVKKALEEALTLLNHKIEMQQIVLEKKIGTDALVSADFGQLRQAFVNILLNACDAMPEGGRLTVSTGILPDGKRVEIAFTDTGPGIAPENLNRIFDPFFTTKEMGTGLGLSVVYGIVQKHGGEMKAESRPGVGTTMRIRLPLAAAAPEAAA